MNFLEVVGTFTIIYLLFRAAYAAWTMNDFYYEDNILNRPFEAEYVHGKTWEEWNDYKQERKLRRIAEKEKIKKERRLAEEEEVASGLGVVNHIVDEGEVVVMNFQTGEYKVGNGKVKVAKKGQLQTRD